MVRYPHAVERALSFFPEADPEEVLRRLRLGTFVSVPSKYIYFLVRKAACTQMAYLLRRLEAAGPVRILDDETLWDTRRDMFVHDRANVPLPSLVDLDNSAQREVLEAPDFLRMTLVRNPYSRLLSGWKNKILACEPISKDVYLELRGRMPAAGEGPTISFAEFVDYVETACDSSSCDGHWMRQTDYTLFPAMNFNFVGKLERFDDALRRLQQHLRLSQPLVPERLNESLPLGHAGYSEALAAKAYSIYRADFDILGYDSDSWVRYKEKGADEQAGVSLSEERVRDEIVERNLVILALYEERKQLRARVRWAKRLGLLPVLDGLAAVHFLLIRAARKARRLGRAILPPTGSALRRKHAAPSAQPKGAGKEDLHHEPACRDSNSRV